MCLRLAILCVLVLTQVGCDPPAKTSNSNTGDENSDSTGGPSTDSGGPSTDSGGPLTDGGGPLTDGGGPLTDGGATSDNDTPGDTGTTDDPDLPPEAKTRYYSYGVTWTAAPDNPAEVASIVLYGLEGIIAESVKVDEAKKRIRFNGTFMAQAEGDLDFKAQQALQKAGFQMELTPSVSIQSYGTKSFSF